MLVLTNNTKGILENLSKGMRIAEWKMSPPSPPLLFENSLSPLPFVELSRGNKTKIIHMEHENYCYVKDAKWLEVDQLHVQSFYKGG